MKIGILCPRSNAHPEMTINFMNGIRASIEHQRLTDRVHLFSESVGFGGQEKEVYEKAERLLVMTGIDFLIAFVDLRILELLKPLFYASGKPVLVVNPGANYPQNWLPQKNILYLTLQHSFLCWLSGKLAGGEGKCAATASTFYDCGYLHTAAMVRGFVQAGGRVSYNYVNKQRYDESFDIGELTEYLSKDPGPHVLLSVFDTLPASLFFAALNGYTQKETLQVLVSPMMLEEKALLPLSGHAGYSIGGYIPWHFSLGHKNNEEFRDCYEKSSGKVPDVFSLLGWEAMLVGAQFMSAGGERKVHGDEAAGLLQGVVISSPRGAMSLDMDTNYFVAPVCKCSMPPGAAQPEIGHITDFEADWADFTSVALEGVNSGWTNTYLCY